MKNLSNNSLSSKSGKLLLGITLLIGLLLTLNSASAQEPSGAATTPDKANFYQIQKNFNDYWKGRVVTRSSGYKPFKRWEWYWEPRVNPDGTFPPNNIVVKEWERFSAEKSVNSTVGDWKAIGPDKPATADPQIFYYGTGRINCMAFHPTDANIFWVGTPAGGLWRTNDFGKTWTTRHDLNPVLGVSDIIINKENPLIMYIATGDYDGSGSACIGAINEMRNGDTKSIGVLKSTDGGQTWQNTQLQWEVKDEYLISRLIAHPDSSNTLYVATSVGLYKTTDGGKYWSRLELADNPDICDIAFNPANPKIIYAATRGHEVANSTPKRYRSGQVYRSTDWGKSWKDSTQFDSIKRIKLAVTPQDSNLLEALCVNTNEGLKRIYRSVDKGRTFPTIVVDVKAPYKNNYLHNDKDPSTDKENPTGGQGDYDVYYLINPKNQLERWIGGVNTWKSTDGGTNWALANYWTDYNNSSPVIPIVHADKHWFGFHPLQPSTFFECNDGGVYYTKNGGTSWVDITKGMQIGQIFRISGSYWEPDLVIAGFQDIGSAVRTAPDKWITHSNIGGDGTECLIDWLNPKVQYCQYPQGLLMRTKTGDWAQMDTVSKKIVKKDGNPQKGSWITPFVIHPNKPEVLYAGYLNIWKTNNRGDNWDSTSSLLIKSGKEELIRTLAISESDPKVMWSGTSKQLFKTTDEWNTCDTIQLKKFLPDGRRNYITGIAIHPEKPNVVFVTCSGFDSLKVFKTKDGGVNWENISGNSLPKLPVNCIAYEEDSQDGVYIGTDVGVFYKDSTMAQWIPFNKNLPNVMVTDLEIEQISGKIRAATYGRGLWESDLYVASGFSKITDVEIPKNGGVATGGGTYPSGTKVTMTATPLKSYSFEGWFENGVKIDSAASFTFTVQENRNLIARFGYPIGIEDKQKSRIHLFPNPTKGLVEVRLDKGVGEDLQKTTVISMQGKTVYESNTKVDNDQISMDLSAHPQGNYLITFYFKSGGKVSYTLLITR